VSLDQIRSIGCGPIGAVVSAILASLIFNWQAKRWSRWVPLKCGKKDKDQLLKEYKNTNRIAKIIGAAGLFGGLLYYRGHWTTGADWRGMGIAFGLMAFLPVCYIAAAGCISDGKSVREAMVAFVIDQRTPPKVLFVLIGICFITGLICAISVLIEPPSQ
jgi:hypothetical protein